MKEKRLKGLRQRPNSIKSVQLSWQLHFHVSQFRSKVIAKQEDERTRNYEKGSKQEKDDDSRGLPTEVG